MNPGCDADSIDFPDGPKVPDCLAGGGISIGAGSPCCCWSALSTGCSAARDLFVQARAGAGCGLRDAIARAATGAARPYRRNPRKPIRGDCRESGNHAEPVLRHLLAKRPFRWGCGKSPPSADTLARKRDTHLACSSGIPSSESQCAWNSDCFIFLMTSARRSDMGGELAS
jgi:hypothetical protein